MSSEGKAVSSRRVVALGGGHGLAKALGALRRLDIAPTAVVTVADDGGSSGRLRDELGVIPPGDLRMALLALARNQALAEALAWRFQGKDSAPSGGTLQGHALGNLLLVALAQRADNDFVAALEAAAALLDCDGRVLPVTTDIVRLHARVGGRELSGQVRIATAQERVEQVWVEPSDPAACTAAVEAIEQADGIVLGPGSLYTSIIAALLIPGIAKALTSSGVPVIYVANVRTQVGETSGLDLAAHVDALFAHVPGLRIDTVIAHEGPIADAAGEPLLPVLPDERVGRLITADVISRKANGDIGWGHDTARLSAALEVSLRT